MKTTERRAKRMTGAWAALVLAAAMGGGCCLAPPRPPPPPPKNTQENSLRWVDPAPDGYYTGARPNFAYRSNPDPLGRKFRVAFLRMRLHSVDGKAGEDVKAVTQSTMRGLSTGYLPLRKWERDIARGVRDPGDNPPNGTFPKLEKSYFAYEKSSINFINAVAGDSSNKQGGAFGEPGPRGFARHWNDVDYLNAELASRYPALFTTSWSGFPVEIAMVGLFTESRPVTRTRFEAWIVGLPEHDNAAGKMLFTPSEVYLDPYAAIAASLFKLSDTQFRGLAATEPGDFRWLVEE